MSFIDIITGYSKSLFFGMSFWICNTIVQVVIATDQKSKINLKMLKIVRGNVSKLSLGRIKGSTPGLKPGEII